MMENDYNDQPWTLGDRPPPPAKYPPPRTWDFGHALIFYIFLVGGTIAVGVALMLTMGFRLSALLTELVLYLALPFVLSRLLDTGWNEWIKWPQLGAGGWITMIMALLGLGTLVSNIPVAVDRIYPMSQEYIDFFEQFLRADSAGDLALLFIIAALVPGICEEITFRGLIQGGIRTTYGPTVAVVVTSILFAVIHMSIWNFFSLILMGLFLGMLREKTGSIWPGAVAHVVNNGIALFAITAAPPSENAWHYDFFPLWVNLPAAALLLGGLILFRRQMAIKSAAPVQEESY